MQVKFETPCIQADSLRIERFQLNAAKIETGLTLFSTQSSLYIETGWETLAEKKKKINFALL